MLVRRSLRSLCSKANGLSSLARQTKPQHPADSNLKSLCLNGRLKEALFEMAVLGTEVKFSCYDSLITECLNQRALREGQRVHVHMIKSRYLPPVYLGTRLMILYAKCDSLEDARNVLDGMPERNIVSWTAMISGYSQRGCHAEALELFIRMLQTGLLPNEFTLATVLTSCSGPHGFKHGRQVHSLVVKTNFESHIFVGSSLLDMYAKADKIHEARTVFDMLPERDVVTCTAIISGYAQLGLDEEALELFRKLYEEGMECNYITFASLLTALSGLSALDYGRQVHSLTIRRELPFYVVLQNSLINMYSKCGCLIYARRVFDSMPERTVISWNAMLVGLGKHGLGRQVLQLFKSMREELKPDGVTFMAVLSGCSHGGLVDEGLDVFDYMLNEQGLKPELGHYGCVVDLLGRAGRIEKVLDFIKDMPFEPTAAMWGSLLGACRVHANASVGEFVAQRLLEIEPENAGNYVILSNIYAAAGRWEDVVRVRESMKEKTVMKEPGRSWLNLDRIIHTFHSSDRSHPQKEAIDAKLKELCVKIKEAGYVPDLSCVLHDVDDEQKERMLLGHSEKLAITFGLMGTSRSGMIRVTKNLRICVDCHNFAKFVSKVYGRDLSLRDSNRFHLIVGGVCSCRDYW
ncbi:putative pentatricopeptide repeat-containing protein At3g13770, mitochondrial [Elaeis guineensis]|uniref:Pentatricopeptide repeat-containing protein At3g13770, mitochondrial n=1 Tax=Elaeis guineensis var. tenera TaxID=51953 RepID=A0A6I9RVD3_ELAGV|nr:putative pentatricopeptide repeat-containing protein At3g13770, mitochondrial [Elaeis guineensis]